MVKILDYILFREKSHLKRGSGFTTITPKFLASKKSEICKKLHLNNIINSIILYFKKEYSDKEYSDNNTQIDFCTTEKRHNI